jgi:hypothetical protein
LDQAKILSQTTVRFFFSTVVVGSNSAAMNMLFVVLSLSAVANGYQTEALGANPIRKIVSLLQNMQKEIEAEGAKEKELFDKFMCFCSGNNGELSKAAEDAKAKIEELTAKVTADEATQVQTKLDLAAAKTDRASAQSDIEEAAALRAKEASEYAAEKADSETNIAAMTSAIPAIEKGMGGASLLQVPGADRVKKIVASYPSVSAMDRKNAIAFLEAGTGESGDYAPASGQIVGILKGMKDDMEASLKEAIAEEEKSIAGFGDLKASKLKEIEMATEAIETKTTRSGELAVTIVQDKDSIEDTESELADTQKFLVQLETQCATKEKEMAERTKIRSEEVKAISEAISILNDDDALDVFKKAALPQVGVQEVGFLQRGNSPASRVMKAQGILASIKRNNKSSELDLLLFTLNSKLKLHGKGKTQGLEGVIKMIDDMVALLGKDQGDDDTQKEFCETEFDKAGDEHKAATEKQASLAASIEVSTDSLATLSDDIAALVQDVKDLDKAVAQATEQRKEEHADFLEAQQLSEAAIQLIAKAKNRLQKFYNPTLYKAPPKTENTMEEKIIEAGTFAQISDDLALSQPYEKSEKSAGVIGLMDMMAKELETDMKDAAYEEKTSQGDYQKLMDESQATRAANTKSITAKESTKATEEASLVALKESKAAADEDLSLINKYVADLHVSCDFIIQNFDLRKEARTNEMESLKNAKAILSGANFGF